MRSDRRYAGESLRRRDSRGDALDRLLHASAGNRLAQIVQGMQLEGLNGAAVMRADEDQLGGAGEAPQHAGELETVQVGHADVEEDAVVGLAGDERQRFATVGGAFHLAHVRRAAQDPGEIVQRGALIVDGEQHQSFAAHIPALARAPTTVVDSPVRLGTLMVTVVPRPSCDSILSP